MNMRMASCVSAAAAAFGFGAADAQAIINPNFTPADLVRSSDRVLVLKVSAPADGVVKAECLEAAKGQAPADKTLAFRIRDNAEMTMDDVVAAMGARPTAIAVVCLLKPESVEPDAPVGSLLVNTLWFSVYGKPGDWRLDKDTRELFAVWAGSARQLGRAAQYVQADPGADFPVKARISWEAEVALGKVAGGANGCLAADLGGAAGACAILLSSGGDKVYRMGAKESPASDITDKTKLTTASRQAAVGDCDGDGRLDLVSWDGKSLKLAAGAADGTFTVRDLGVTLEDCVSLDVLDAGVTNGRGILVGTPKGIVWIGPDGAGKYAARPLAGGEAAGADLGGGGVCGLGDFNNDGRCDAAQFFTKGMVLYAGEGAGRFRAPVVTRMGMVKTPRTVVCGDYDADGQLDAVVGGEDGIALASRNEAGQWENLMFVTGELAYHGNANQPSITAVVPADINNDGRQGVALFSNARKPMMFFNRGFGCFGWARELDLAGALTGEMAPPMGETTPKPTLKAMQALQQGPGAGIVADADGDGFCDLIGVDAAGEVWALLGKSDGRGLGALLALDAAAAQPLTVSVFEKQRLVGMHVLRPGVPVLVGKVNPGVYSLRWVGADGKPGSRQAMVTGVTRVNLTP